MSFRDTKNQTTTYVYDGLGRLSSVTYADGRTESFVYDATGNATQVTQPDGTVLTQVFDDLGRLASRTVNLAPGLGGHTTESFGYDGLGRMTSADLQGVVSTFVYDGLARLERDTTAGKSLAYEFDAAEQTTLLTFPSTFKLQQWWDALGHLDQAKGDATLGAGLFIQYGWQGSLAGSKWVGTESGGASAEIVSGTWQRSADKLTRGSYFLGSTGAKLLHEELWREGRGQLRGQAYHDRGGIGWQRAYDAAGRLTGQTGSGSTKTATR